MKNKLFYKWRYFCLPLMICMLNACGNENDSPKVGGTFNFAISNEPKTFLARNVGDFYSATLLNQIYEGLVTFNPHNLLIDPCLAKSWTISPDGKTIRFELREDVYFQKNKKVKEAIKLQPSDVVFSIELACTPYKGGETYAFAAIYKNALVGAKEFYEQKTDHISGISVEGNTVVMQLRQRDVNFIKKMALCPAAIVSEKIVTAGLETDLIGTGPFCFTGYLEINGHTEIILVKNENYWGKDKSNHALPYLDSLVFKVINNEMEQLRLFEEGKINFIDGLPPSKISSMLGKGKIEDFNGAPPKLVLIRKPLLGTQYYMFNCQRPPFDQKKVRKAINYAINKKSIVQGILKNQAYSIGNGGIVPPAGFKGYDAKAVKEYGYTFQPIKAKKILADAGYPNGDGFPTISIKYDIGSSHYEVANEIALQLHNVLNINVNLEGEPFDMLLQDENYGRGGIFRSAWYADYFSPESFLMLGYGKSIPKDSTAPSAMNSSRYNNPTYDALLEKAMGTRDIVKRYNYYVEAEQILMKDAPFAILWYDETIKIIPSYVRGLQFNAGDYYIFKNTYFKSWSEEEWLEHINKTDK